AVTSAPTTSPPPPTPTTSARRAERTRFSSESCAIQKGDCLLAAGGGVADQPRVDLIEMRRVVGEVPGGRHDRGGARLRRDAEHRQQPRAYDAGTRRLRADHQYLTEIVAARNLPG